LVDGQKQPLTIATQVGSYLKQFGPCRQVYATAEFQPFSSTFKPDLLFQPEKGPRAGQVVFIEFTQNFRGLQGKSTVSMFDERREFVSSYVEIPIGYHLIFTDLEVDSFTRNALQRKATHVCKYSNDLDDVIGSFKSLAII
jgi:hypothetical protein